MIEGEGSCTAICYNNESCDEVHSTHLTIFFVILAIILILILIYICYKFVSNRIRYQQMEELNIINNVLPENNFEMVEMVEIQIKSEDEDEGI
jgi:amino acid permease